jgi:hypothetical protein
VVQLDVIEAFGILVFRTEVAGKAEAAARRIYVFQLSDMQVSAAAAADLVTLTTSCRRDVAEATTVYRTSLGGTTQYEGRFSNARAICQSQARLIYGKRGAALRDVLMVC